MSMEYLNEATLDYKEQPFESRFVINNPKTKTSCGCGSSVGF
jgi:iron-sulfur cluster insertion protein